MSLQDQPRQFAIHNALIRELTGSDDDELIKRGDRVSWRLDGYRREFGRVVRVTVKDYERAFSVREEIGGMGRIIPATSITKEVG